jgi:hypothetical protein
MPYASLPGSDRDSGAGETTTVVAGADPADDRPILFVGDIQGCARELARLVEKANFRIGAHRLLPVGDTINRGPEAPAVLAILRETGAEPIVGNHELSLLELGNSALPARLADNPRSAAWQLREAGQWEAALAWIRTWPHARRGPDWLAVHAGLHPRLPVEKTAPDYLANVRYCTAGGELPGFGDGNLADDPPGFRPWFCHYQGKQTVIFGHWARRGLIRQDRLRGLDSGCVYGGRLTGLWWPDDRIVQVGSFQPRR